MLYSLKDKVAVVTGASSGLGADSARAYAEAGAKVACSPAAWKSWKHWPKNCAPWAQKHCPWPVTSPAKRV